MDRIKTKVENSKWQITLLTLICITIVSGVVMCISYKFQKKITRPLTKIIQFTKILSTVEDGQDKKYNPRSKMTIKDIPDGIFQSAELVERFKKILFGMNKKNESVMFSYNKDNSTAFPFNELHPTSPFSNMIDWDSTIAKLQNNQNLQSKQKMNRMGTVMY